MCGWIKLHRKITNWEWYGDINCRCVFLHLLLTANHEDKKWMGQNIKRGQKITSLHNLATETNLSVQRVRTALKRLESTREITSVRSTINTVITITNYDIYQRDNTNPNNQPTNDQQTTNNQLTTNKNEKNYKNVKNNISMSASSKKFIKPTVAEIHAYMQERNFNSFVEAEKFYDHFESNGWRIGGKTPMKDWKASVRNWVRNSSTKPIPEVPEMFRGMIQ